MCLFTSETHQVEVKKNWLKDLTGQFSRPLSLIEQKQSTDQSVGRRFLFGDAARKWEATCKWMREKQGQICIVTNLHTLNVTKV